MTAPVHHIVGLSGGKDSTAMALALADQEPRAYTYVCTPTGDEFDEMIDHWRYLRDILPGRFVFLSSGHSLDGLIRHYSALPNWRQRWCTRQLKIEPTKDFLLQHAPCVSYVGLRADEPERQGIYGDIEGVSFRYPLREWGWGLRQVIGYLDSRGVAIPRRTDCARCFFQTLGEWWRLWRDHSDIYSQAEGQEAATGHTFRSPGRDSWPASLMELRREFEAGRIPRGAEPNLSLFTGELQQCRVCSL
jgi:hypothetical protein